MATRLKSLTFIDTLTFELADSSDFLLDAVLKDEQGTVCNALTTKIQSGIKTFAWTGFNHLPYGVYTLEISDAREKSSVRLVKRI